jgi:hypothetical protein
MPRKALPSLPDSPRVKVFRQIESILRNDPTLRQLIGSRWQTWDGSPDAKAPLAKTQTPAIMLSRAADANTWFAPDAMVEPLVVDVEIEVDSTNQDDPDNLWYAVVRAIYPTNPKNLSPSPRQVIQDALVKAGAFTGVCDFTQPAVAPVGTEGAPDSRQYALGRIKLDVLLNINV